MGGAEAEYGLYPFAVSLKIRTVSRFYHHHPRHQGYRHHHHHGHHFLRRYLHFCGGAAITTSAVLTAAHCIAVGITITITTVDIFLLTIITITIIIPPIFHQMIVDSWRQSVRRGNLFVSLGDYDVRKNGRFEKLIRVGSSSLPLSSMRGFSSPASQLHSIARWKRSYLTQTLRRATLEMTSVSFLPSTKWIQPFYIGCWKG